MKTETHLNKKKVMVVMGTRPEAIKMAPLVRELERSKILTPVTCATAQHRDLLDQVLKLFQLVPDFDLDLMKPNQDLFDVTINCLEEIKRLFQKNRPDLVLVQGDTATTFTAALAAFYCRIPVGHVEAGLRSGDPYSPFPEEAYRRMVTRIAAFHFVPTPRAGDNLTKEGVNGNRIYLTGNTGIDALLWARTLELEQPELKSVLSGQPMILLTLHRRENFGEPVREAFTAIRSFAIAHPQVQIVYPMHPNPNVTEPAREILSSLPNVALIGPVSYRELVFLLESCHCVLTDSGGIQEEAPSFGKPVLVLRDNTERPEAVDAGCAKLVGTNARRILDELENLFAADSDQYRSMARPKNPFGDGLAAKRIVSIVEDKLCSIRGDAPCSD